MEEDDFEFDNENGDGYYGRGGRMGGMRMYATPSSSSWITTTNTNIAARGGWKKKKTSSSDDALGWNGNSLMR